MLVCVFDQVIYLKAIKIKWKEKQKFGNIVLMMRMFHMVMMYMHILSKRFSDGGIHDILIQSGTIAEDLMDKALFSKMYNRGMRACKMVYKVISRKIFEEIGVNNAGNVLVFDITNTTLRKIKENYFLLF